MSRPTRAEVQEGIRAVLLRGLSPGPNGWARAPCPFCGEVLGRDDRDRRGALAFNFASGGFVCFRCSTKGYVDEWLTYDVGPGLPEESDDSDAKRPPDSFEPLWREPGWSSAFLAPARRYLATRVPPSLWERLQLGACPDGRCAGRVVVPVLPTVESRHWMGWIARLWRKVPDVPTYVYPRGWDRRAIIWNGEALTEETDVPALVVEGAFDAIHLWPDGVALLGLPPTPEQVAALAASRRPVAVVLDGDAWEQGWALAQQLRLEGVRAGYVRLPPRIDPDQVEAARVKEAARRSIDED